MYLWTEYKNTEETPQHTVEYNMISLVVWQKCKIHKKSKKKISVSKINYFNRRVPESKQPMLRWNRQIMLLVAKVVLTIAPHLLFRSCFFVVVFWSGWKDLYNKLIQLWMQDLFEGFFAITNWIFQIMPSQVFF